MIKNSRLFAKFDDHYFKNLKYSLKEKFKIYDGMYTWARKLGVFPLKDPFEGIKSCLRIARALNHKKFKK